MNVKVNMPNVKSHGCGSKISEPSVFMMMMIMMMNNENKTSHSPSHVHGHSVMLPIGQKVENYIYTVYIRSLVWPLMKLKLVNFTSSKLLKHTALYRK